MEIRQLEIFRILARELSFTRAAEKAHCVQSNVTVQIRGIENELGVPLFERLGKQVRLTDNGQRLLPYAERILRLLEEASVVAVGADRPTGTLYIGSPESVLTYRLPPVLQVFRSTFPEVDLAFRASGTRELIPQLELGELDIGLVIDDAFEHQRLHIEVLCKEPLSLLVRPDHPLLQRPKLAVQDMASQSFLLTDVGCAYRTKLEKALAHALVTPKSIMEFTSVETIKQCAALGMGVACLPAIVAESEIAAGKLATLPWSGTDLSMRTLVVWHKDKWLSPAINAFVSLLRERLAPMKSKHAVPTQGPGIGDHRRLSKPRRRLTGASR
jgi:DNA-binding transcriptional LysR family regulator